MFYDVGCDLGDRQRDVTCRGCVQAQFSAEFGRGSPGLPDLAAIIDIEQELD